MTDNKLWDTIINPIAIIELIESNKGLNRGVRITYPHNKGSIVVEEIAFDDIGTNYKKARQSIIKEVRELM